MQLLILPFLVATKLPSLSLHYRRFSCLFISSSFANDSFITSPRRSRRSALSCVALRLGPVLLRHCFPSVLSCYTTCDSAHIRDERNNLENARTAQASFHHLSPPDTGTASTLTSGLSTIRCPSASLHGVPVTLLTTASSHWPNSAHSVTRCC